MHSTEFMGAIHSTEILACSKRSDSGERCEVKKGMKSRGGLGREFIFSRSFSHRSPLSERLEQATEIPTGPIGKSGSPKTVNQFFRNFSGWTEPIH